MICNPESLSRLSSQATKSVQDSGAGWSAIALNMPVHLREGIPKDASCQNSHVAEAALQTGRLTGHVTWHR